MKKPLLATLGLAGACAACCAIPVLVPLVSGLSVTGMLGFDGGQLSIGREGLALGLGAMVALVAGLGLWADRHRRRHSVAACTYSTEKANSAASSCGCDRPAKAAAAGLLSVTGGAKT